MCRPSCCKNSGGGDGAGIAAIVIIIAGAAVAARLAPAVISTLHVVVEAIKIAVLIGAALTAGAVLGWLSVIITRWRSRHRRALAAVTTAPADRADQISGADESRDCLACGGKGTVLRAITASQYQPSPCPVCEPVGEARR